MHQLLLAWLIGVDGGCLAAVALWVALYHVLHPRPEGFSALAGPATRAAYATSYMLAVILLTIVAIWDSVHPEEQFPYGIRMWFTLPVLVLGNYALFSRVWKRNPK